jgi:hypothetical protein
MKREEEEMKRIVVDFRPPPRSLCDHTSLHIYHVPLSLLCTHGAAEARTELLVSPSSLEQKEALGLVDEETKQQLEGQRSFEANYRKKKPTLELSKHHGRRPRGDSVRDSERVASLSDPAWLYRSSDLFSHRPVCFGRASGNGDPCCRIVSFF